MKIKVTVHYYDYKWWRGKLIINKKKLNREKFRCKSISIIGNGKRFSFLQKHYSTNIDAKQIKKLIIEQ